MLLLHEVHTVMGERSDQFERSYREVWMPALASDGDARLLWYLDQAHGTGPAYTVVTITALSGGAAWERLDKRVRDGDLRDWSADVGSMRHQAVGKLLLAAPWSPLQTVDMHAVPAAAGEHPPVLYMEDTGWPVARLDDYVRFWDEAYHRRIEARPASERLLEVAACFEVAFGSHGRPEAILMQRILEPERLLALLAMRPEAREASSSSSYMSDALRYRDHWESRLLRSSTWSPLP